MSAITPSDFDFVRELLHSQAAIVLEDGKEYLVECRLLPVAQQAGMNSVSDLVSDLRLRGSPLMIAHVIDAMTTNETLFFRDIHPFQALKNHVIPELLQRNESTRTINIWSSACSSGQEPYSIAMLIREHFPQLLNWSVRILATDISTLILERARAARYSLMEMNRGLPAAYLIKYFERDGAEWRIRDDIRSMVEFRDINLIGRWGIEETMDIVFLRNVMIYFDMESKRKVLAKMRQVLDARGYLFLGSCETMVNLSDAYRQTQFDQAWCYQLGPERVSN